MIIKNGGRGMIYTLSVFSNNVRVSYGDVCDYYDCEALIQQANEWAGKDNWNRLELTIEEGQVLPIIEETV